MSDDVAPDEEQELRGRIAEIERRRITVGDAYRSIHLGFGTVLFRIGKGWIVWLEVLATIDTGLAALAAATLTPMALILCLLGLLAVAALGIATEVMIEDWVAEYNAGLDEELRLALRDAAGDDPADRDQWPRQA